MNAKPSPYRPLYSPVAMAGTVCQQIEARSKMPAPIIEQAKTVKRLCDEASTVITTPPHLTDGTIRKMWAHGQSFVRFCHNHGMITDASTELPQILLARLMSGHLCINHYTRSIGVSRYPMWRELESEAASLLAMMLDATGEEWEAQAYAVAEDMVLEVAPPAPKQRRKAA